MGGPGLMSGIEATGNSGSADGLWQDLGFQMPALSMTSFWIESFLIATCSNNSALQSQTGTYLHTARPGEETA